MAYDAQVPLLPIYSSQISPHTGSLGNMFKDICHSTSLVSGALEAISIYIPGGMGKSKHDMLTMEVCAVVKSKQLKTNRCRHMDGS